MMNEHGCSDKSFAPIATLEQSGIEDRFRADRVGRTIRCLFVRVGDRMTGCRQHKLARKVLLCQLWLLDNPHLHVYGQHIS